MGVSCENTSVYARGGGGKLMGREGNSYGPRVDIAILCQLLRSVE